MPVFNVASKRDIDGLISGATPTTHTLSPQTRQILLTALSQVFHTSDSFWVEDDFTLAEAIEASQWLEQAKHELVVVV